MPVQYVVAREQRSYSVDQVVPRKFLRKEKEDEEKKEKKKKKKNNKEEEKEEEEKEKKEKKKKRKKKGKQGKVGGQGERLIQFGRQTDKKMDRQDEVRMRHDCSSEQILLLGSKAECTCMTNGPFLLIITKKSRSHVKKANVRSNSNI